jgi:hypothetical protein
MAHLPVAKASTPPTAPPPSCPCNSSLAGAASRPLRQSAQHGYLQQERPLLRSLHAIAARASRRRWLGRGRVSRLILSPLFCFDRWLQVGRTEVIDNNLSPRWQKSFALDYYFESTQWLRFDVCVHPPLTLQPWSGLIVFSQLRLRLRQRLLPSHCAYLHAPPLPPLRAFVCSENRKAVYKYADHTPMPSSPSIQT